MGNNCENCESTDQLNNLSTAINRRSRSHSQMSINEKNMVQIKTIQANQQYAILNPPLGNGSFGSVFKAIHRSTGMVRVIKKIQKNNNKLEQLSEIMILKKLDHPNIVRIYDVYLQQSQINIVMQYCTGGQLFDRIITEQYFTENIVRSYMKQLLLAINNCHQVGIMHRDLKPQNIMFSSKSSNTLKIIDFGTSTRISNENKTTQIGSAYYMAPEVIKKNYNQKCDIWSLGVIMYLMLCSSPPFVGETNQIIFSKILQGKINFQSKKWNLISAQAQKLLQKMLKVNYRQRVSAKQALMSPWFELETGHQNLIFSEQIKSIQKFYAMSKFQLMITNFLQHNLIASECLDNLQMKFKQIDINKDGRISLKQFKQCYKQFMPKMNNAQVTNIFHKIDQNNSGYIDYSEFVSSCIKLKQNQDQDLINRSFQLIDRDGNGHLTRDQLLYAFGGFDQQLYNEVLNQCDVNKDGLISKIEFKSVMDKILSSK